MTELQKKQIETCRENGLTFAEIADVTGLSVGAVNVKIASVDVM